MPACRAALSLIFLSVLSFAQSSFPLRSKASPPANAGKLAGFASSYSKLPLSFEANQGQTNAKVRFLSRGAGYTLFLTPQEAVFSLRNATHANMSSLRPQVRNARVRMKLVATNSWSTITGLDPLPGKSNYFVGNKSSDWHSAIPSFAKVRYQGVYPGIDLVFYGNQQQLEYDFYLAPHANVHNLQFAIDGASHIRRTRAGDLMLQTDVGVVRWRKPIAYQEINGRRQNIPVRYTFRSRNRIAFNVDHYDSSRPLIVDPVFLYSTYLGGSAFDRGNGIAVDGSGNSYIAGYTASANFPTSNALQPSCSTTCGDVFITKFDPLGTLLYSTFLGGTGGSGAFGIAVDGSGNAYVTGWTLATNFPTLNAIQPVCSNSCAAEDAFVSVLNASGSALVYSTYLGGSSTDYAQSIAVDSSGDAYITGSTNSTDFPLLNPLQATCINCGSPTSYSHAFVTEISPSGGSFIYSTFLGGSGDDHGNSIAVDSAGDAYITGSTSSTDFPRANSFQADCLSCVPATSYTSFVSKIAPAGTSFTYSTFFGGSGGDQGNGIAVDTSDNVYVTGYTNSTDFPTLNPLENKPTGTAAGQDAYVAKFDQSGASLVYSTYLGGTQSDLGQSLAVDTSGNVYVTGWTQSTDFPIANALQSEYGGGSYDAFVSQINAEGSAFVYSTYLGGSATDQGRSIAVDASGNAYITGGTYSTNFSSINPLQSANTGSGDAFVTKILPASLPATVTLASSANPASANQTVTLIAMVGSQNAGIPTGSVSFQNGSTVLANVPLAAGYASYDATFSANGTQNITAVYSGDGTYSSGTSPVLYEGIGGYPSTTSLTVTPTPSSSGQSVTFIVTVGSTYGLPTGTVTLMNGSASLGTATLSAGVATFNEVFPVPGTQSIIALYSGDSSFASSTSATLPQVVMPTLTVTVTGSGGSVSSSDGLINLCTSSGGPNCAGVYSAGSTVTLTATPASGTTFAWTTASDGTAICSGSSSCTFTISSNTLVAGVFTASGIQPAPTFSIDYNSTEFPTTIKHGEGRFWDTPGVEWAMVQTSSCTTSPCPNSFVWTDVDLFLSNMFQNNVLAAQYSLARTPTFLSSNPNDTTCSYQSLGGGQCDAPADLNADGTGINLSWRNWVAAVSAHVNAPGYTATHAHVQHWEIWNEPDILTFWGGSSPATQGTFDQLIRMEEDAYCIIKGGTFLNDYTGESCAAIQSSVTSVLLSGPIDPTATIMMPSYHGGSASLPLASCFLYGAGASGGLCQGRPLHYLGAGAAHTDVVNFHMKPGSTPESQLDSWITAIQQILAPAESAKPFFNSEGGYDSGGWSAPFDSSDMQEAYIGRFYVYSIYKGMANTVWYNYSPTRGGLGTSAPPNDANTAYSSVFNWMIGAAIPSCSLSSDGVNPGTSLYTCTTTLANGTPAQIMWDTDPSLYCTGTSCPAISQLVAPAYLSYLDLAGNKNTITNQSVAVGIKPILVQAQ